MINKTFEDFPKKFNIRVLCKINDQIELQCAILSKKKGGSVIYVGYKIRKELKIKTTPTAFKTLSEFDQKKSSTKKIDTASL